MRRSNGQEILLKDDETVCIQCGKLIVNKATGRGRKFCSVKCKQKWVVAHPKKNYEQMEYLISQLKKGEVVENTPQWIKDLIGVK